MKPKKWMIGWLILVLIPLLIIGLLVYGIDPYFHYHEPDTNHFFYYINNERSQNDGISKFFQYDALITGTSMTENFKTSDMDEIFGVHSVKVPFSGATYKEVNDNLCVALEHNPNLKTIVRGLDRDLILDDKDIIREDLGNYPTYLYDNNPFNDVKYMFNKDIIFGRIYEMLIQSNDEGFVPGTTPFDEYANWHYDCTYGKKSAWPGTIVITEPSSISHLSDADKEIIYGNITQNVTSLADLYPDVDFYYFITPYSAASWISCKNNGSLDRVIEIEQYAIELILEHPNIHLYSFNNRIDITKDLNNYKDDRHYAQWINSLVLRWMKDGNGLLTKENYLECLENERNLYSNFDYTELNSQVDYENDFYAAALLNEELTGATPIDLLTEYSAAVELQGAQFVKSDKGSLRILCTDSNDNENSNGYEYVGAKIRIDDIGKHNYLVFNEQKETDCGQPNVYVYNDAGVEIVDTSASQYGADGQWHQYVVDLSYIEGGITILLNGQCANSNNIFSEIILY